MLERSILQGVYDLHIHTGPSVAKRLLDAGDMMKCAMEAGYAGFLVKDHYVPSAHGCLMVERHLGDGSCRALSSIALNNSVGGLNLMALDAAYNMGARMVYLPTVSSRFHIEGHKGKKFLGSGGMTTIDLEQPIYLLDGDGKLIPQCVEVLKYVAEKGDLALSTGHISWQESDVLIPAALELGVKNIVVNHPHFDINAPLEAVARWGKMGAWIEKTACEFGQIVFGDDSRFNSITLWRDYLDAGVPLEQIFVSTDFGQSISPHPVEGMFQYLSLLHDKLGFDEATLSMLSKTNPAKIMSLA